MKLNLGCGSSKIEGFVNVDADPTLSPDQCWNFTQKFPIENETVEVVTLYHVIEHIPKSSRDFLLSEIHRVLQPNGLFIVSYPEFLKCVENWKNNVRGKRDFWEATLYGRQSSAYDHHVTIMDTDQFCLQLVRHGFEILYRGSEPGQEFNSVVKAKKCKQLTYEEVLCTSAGFKETK